MPIRNLFKRKTEADLILLKAADIVEERGLAKGTMEYSTGAVCALGAIALAEDRSAKANDVQVVENVEAAKKLCEYLKGQGAYHMTPFWVITGWSDGCLKHQHMTESPRDAKVRVIQGLRDCARS